MGLFKKSLADVEKYRAAQDTGKLTDTLTSKDPDIALAAVQARSVRREHRIHPVRVVAP